MMNEEVHPFEPFLPEGARLLMLGTFPPARHRWSMPFYYPNFQNDMWRIVGHCFFGDKQHFIAADGKHYQQDELKAFLTAEGIALYDTCTCIIRTKNTASDKDLHVVRQTDIPALLQQLPHCRAIVTAGQLATTLCCQQLGVSEPRVGEFAELNVQRSMFNVQRSMFNVQRSTFNFQRLYRMPSSSRAYPMAIERKAEYYQRVFDFCKL